MERILLSAKHEETVLAVLRDGKLDELKIEYFDNVDLVGRIYKGIVKNVVPSVKGFFLDIGIGKNAFLRTKDLLPRKEPLTEGMPLLVQVIKDSTELKGPLVTEKINISGTYTVLLEGTDYIGVSKKIKNENKRELLRTLAREICPSDLGLVIRTAAENADKNIFSNDIKQSVKKLETVKKHFHVAKGPALLYRDSDIVVKAIRDFWKNQSEVFITDSEDIYKRLKGIIREENISDFVKICLYRGKQPLLEAEGVMAEIDQLFRRQVDLPSGGFIIIDHTEALTVIDVNSGAFKAKKMPHEEMVYLINCEAAREISRQIRLRGIGGMILIDFIDMKKESYKKNLVNLLRKEALKDSEKTVVCGMTSLGLVEMTRKRSRHSLWQRNSNICPICKGTGYIKSVKAIVRKICEDLVHISRAGKNDSLVVFCHPDVAAELGREEEQKHIKEFFHGDIKIEVNNHQNREVYSILTNG